MIITDLISAVSLIRTYERKFSGGFTENRGRGYRSIHNKHLTYGHLNLLHCIAYW